MRDKMMLAGELNEVSLHGGNCLGSQSVHASRYKVSKFWGCNAQHGDSSNALCIFESCQESIS